MTGVPRRSEGWKISDIMEVLVERVNCYYRKKKSTEFEVDTLRARGSAVGEYDRGYMRYSYSEEDDTDDDRYGPRVIRMIHMRMGVDRRLVSSFGLVDSRVRGCAE